MTDKRSPRDRDIISELTVEVKSDISSYGILAKYLQSRCLLNHLNRTMLHFNMPNGTRLSFTVWPHDGDHERYRRACDQLNWSEH